MDVDEEGRLVDVRYHDGQLLGVSLQGNGNALLRFTSVDGEESRLELRGIHLLNINEFREGNTINAVYIWNSKSVPSETVARFSQVAGIREQELVKQIELNEYIVFYLECSYGAEIFSTAEECRLVGSSE